MVITINGVTEEQINSEIQMLQSTSLANVVVDPQWNNRPVGSMTQAQYRSHDKAVDNFEKHLSVDHGEEIERDPCDIYCIRSQGSDRRIEPLAGGFSCEAARDRSTAGNCKVLCRRSVSLQAANWTRRRRSSRSINKITRLFRLAIRNRIRIARSTTPRRNCEAPMRRWMKLPNS